MRTVVATAWVLVFGLVGSWGCTPKNEDPGTVGYWLDRLDDASTRVEALKELGKLGDAAAIEAVSHWLDQEGDWQPDAAYTLGQLGDKRVAATLVAHIDYAVGTGRDTLTRTKNHTNRNIARALALLGAKEAVAPLLQLLTTPEPKTREAAIRALGEIRDEAAVDALADIALHDAQPFLRKVAVQALGDLGSPKAATTLTKMLYMEVPGISFYHEARLALLQVGPATAPLLQQTLERKNAEVEAIRLADGAPIADGAIEAKAAAVLGALGAIDAIDPMIAALGRYYRAFEQRDRQPVYASVPGAVMEICYALGALGALGGEKALQALLPIAADTDPNIRRAAGEALTLLGNPKAVQPLLQAAQKGDADARQIAATAAAKLGSAADLPRFDALATSAALKDLVASERVRLLAAGQCGKQATCWREKLGDTNERVRERAAFELGWAGANDNVTSLLRAAEDESANVRMAAIASLGRVEKIDVAALQKVYDAWSSKLEYAGVNRELLRLIAARRAGH